MIPIIVAAYIWDHSWSRGKVIACCDNAAVVAVLNSRYSKDKLATNANAKVLIFH